MPINVAIEGLNPMSMFQTQDRGPQFAEPFFADGRPKPTATVITSGILFDACKCTNEISAVFNNGDRDTCVLTSAALRDVLRHFGYPAEMMRIEAAVSNDAVDRFATILGSDGDGSRRRKADISFANLQASRNRPDVISFAVGFGVPSEKNGSASCGPRS
jgi:hypothetical protein